MSNPLKTALRAFPSWFTYSLLIILALLPITEIILRVFFKAGITGSSEYIRHIVLLITFLGGLITTKDGKHLAFNAFIDRMTDQQKQLTNSLTNLFIIMVLTALGFASLSFVLIAIDPSEKVGFIPLQLILLAMPFVYFTIAFLFFRRIEKEKPSMLIPSFIGLAFGLAISMESITSTLGVIFPNSSLLPFMESATAALFPFLQTISLPLIILLAASVFFGAPIFTVLGGLSIFLFIRASGTLAVIPNEAYSILTGPAIVAIPLFTLAGFLLAGGKAGERLVELFKSLLGWMPGGMAVAAVVLFAFFTTFTGASGITILALGGLMSYVLIQNGYSKKFTLGLLTASGSIGLLFPPSLPLIMYGVMAQVNIMHMYIAGLLPGILMLITFMLVGVRHSIVAKTPLHPFNPKVALLSLKNAIWEIMLPIIILLGYFSGTFTLVETSAVAAAYALIVGLFIHKDIKITDLGNILRKCLVLIGGVLIILASAKGLSYYIVDTELPLRLVEGAQQIIHSKYLFLLLLNIALLITGCLMDIFSAIIVVVPLILPLGKAYGIDPIHLGIIFLANMELGYLTPSVGLNLFIASYTFNESLGKLYRFAFPFIALIILNVLLITYLPWMTSILLPK